MQCDEFRHSGGLSLNLLVLFYMVGCLKFSRCFYLGSLPVPFICRFSLFSDLQVVLISICFKTCRNCSLQGSYKILHTKLYLHETLT